MSTQANQQVIYPPSAMPRVDAHTHMDATTQYAKAVDEMDKWGGTITITLAGLFWVKNNNGSNASPASVRQIPANDMVYVKEKLNDRILFVPGAFTIPKNGIWWGVDDIKTFKSQGFVGLKLWPHGAILSSKIPLIHEQLDEAGRQGMPLVGYHTGDPGTAISNSPAFPKFEDDTKERLPQHMGHIVKAFKRVSTQECRSKGLFPGSVAAAAPAAGLQSTLWRDGFQDSILLRKGQLAAMVNYIADNPRRLAAKRANPELFAVVSTQPVGRGRSCAAIGNHYLLDRPLKRQVQISRTVSRDELADRKEELLYAAVHGAVLVSPCISSGEKEIARAALAIVENDANNKGHTHVDECQ